MVLYATLTFRCGNIACSASDRAGLDEPGHAAPVERRGACSDENMIRSQVSRIWSKRRMYTLPSYPLTLTVAIPGPIPLIDNFEDGDPTLAPIKGSRRHLGVNLNAHLISFYTNVHVVHSECT